MFSRIDESELAWFKGWLFRRHAYYVPPGYERQVVLLHPSSHIDRNAEFVPVVGDSSGEGEPSQLQIAALRSVLTDASGPAATAYAGLYDGTPGVPWPLPLGGVVTFVEDNVTYALLRGGLSDVMDYDWGPHRPFFDWLTMLWPADRAWFMTCDPDSSFTVIACGHELADVLLTTPDLRAAEIPDYRWHHLK